MPMQVNCKKNAIFPLFLDFAYIQSLLSDSEEHPVTVDLVMWTLPYVRMDPTLLYPGMSTLQVFLVTPRLRVQHWADILIQSILHKCFVVSSKTCPHAVTNRSGSKNTNKLKLNQSGIQYTARRCSDKNSIIGVFFFSFCKLTAKKMLGLWLGTASDSASFLQLPEQKSPHAGLPCLLVGHWIESKCSKCSD